MSELTAARRWAEELRAIRADLVAQVAAGRSLESVAAALVEPGDPSERVHPGAASTRLLVLCEAVPGVGKVAARRILADTGLEQRVELREVPVEVLRRIDESLVVAGAGSTESSPARSATGQR